MTSTDSDQLSDEALASSISDDGRLSSDAFDSDEEGIVEAGIPPQTGSAEDAELEEETFSVDDFDSDMSIEANPDPLPASSPSNENAPTEVEDTFAATPEKSADPDRSAHPQANGQVAEFRKTLTALSRQLEVDRLTFLYQQLQAEGNELPSLDRIASDIKGDSPLHPLGDQDLYSKRPLARLQGWISGLSFGVGRRAKKFSR